MTTDSQAAPEAGKGQNEKLVIAASSLGTVFEWYDFYLYGLLATALSHHFFSGVNETTGFILALMAFAAGFAAVSYTHLDVYKRQGSRSRVFFARSCLESTLTLPSSNSLLLSGSDQ